MRNIFVNNKNVLYWQIIALILVSFFMYVGTIGLRQIANKMAENPDNIINGCMYYNGYRISKYDTKIYKLIIDGYNEDSSRIYVFNSKIPDNYRKYIFEYIEENPNICHEVSYIKINLLFYNRIFLYDFHGDYQPNLN